MSNRVTQRPREPLEEAHTLHSCFPLLHLFHFHFNHFWQANSLSLRSHVHFQLIDSTVKCKIQLRNILMNATETHPCLPAHSLAYSFTLAESASKPSNHLDDMCVRFYRRCIKNSLITQLLWSICWKIYKVSWGKKMSIQLSTP